VNRAQPVDAYNWPAPKPGETEALEEVFPNVVPTAGDLSPAAVIHAWRGSTGRGHPRGTWIYAIVGLRAGIPAATAFSGP